MATPNVRMTNSLYEAVSDYDSINGQPVYLGVGGNNLPEAVEDTVYLQLNVGKNRGNIECVTMRFTGAEIDNLITAIQYSRLVSQNKTAKEMREND